MIYRYSMSSASKEGDTEKFPLLWLRTPNWDANGNVTDIEFIPGDLEDPEDDLWE